MLNIKIEDKNKEKIEKAIKEAEGKARERLLTYNMLVECINTFEKRYQMTTKKYWEGLTIVINPHASSFPNAYKYTPYGTVCAIRRKNGKWVLTRVERDYVKDQHRFSVGYLSEKTKEEILDTMRLF